MKLLDTTFLIDILRGKGGIEKTVERLSNEKVFTTRINAFEIFTGVFSIRSERDREQRIAEAMALFERIEILELDERASILSSQIAGRLNREGRPIEPNDCLIAGIALSNGIEIILTRNIKDFQQIPGITVESY